MVFTIPAYLYNDFHNLNTCSLIRKAEHAADAVIEVESFEGSPAPLDAKYSSDYHGLLHVAKLFRVESTMMATRLSNLQLHSLGFKVRRKRFLIESFTLPPEDAEDNGSSTTQKDPLEF